MDIKIVDGHLREFLKTKATPEKIAETLSLASVSVERIEKFGNDLVYHIEITTNRPDLASVIGIAKETAAVLSQSGINAVYTPPVLPNPKSAIKEKPITINNNPQLVRRINAAVMEVAMRETPQYIKERLEASGIRSLNLIIDITNYVMLTIGHPTHVFDLDRLNTSELNIRESKKGEKITTLDKKEYILPGGDIVADNGKEIVDLLGIMGLENSVVTDTTKRIVFFINNNDPHKIRKTSMTLGIRTEAAQLNEKSLDPELSYTALLYGIHLYETVAEGKLLADIIDIYPSKPTPKTISVTKEKIDSVIGIDIALTKAQSILNSLGFETKIDANSLLAAVPKSRMDDVEKEEDLIEEIARMYGYHNLPSKLPQIMSEKPRHLEKDIFFWEKRVKDALKYWGFTETYTYSMVSEAMYEGPLENAVKLKNPLGDDYMYMRATLVPSLLKVISENKQYKEVKLFELANVYHKKPKGLPEEIPMLAAVIKSSSFSFYHAKGIIEQLAKDLGIKDLSFSPPSKGGVGADVIIGGKEVGAIEVLEEELIDFEINFELLIQHATLHKKYLPLPKYPPVIEDMAFFISEDISTGKIIDLIREQSPLIKDVSLLDRYKDSRTFHILYQDPTKNLATADIASIREKITDSLSKKFNASPKL
ncbi:MAG: phenylalanine--tRNA ligase subunit beta [Candidatus Levybacteria bacterium]|nr:phenylalanine--tRNA ligase subunit beta [Candidatus Levybacteria bacterium]